MIATSTILAVAAVAAVASAGVSAYGMYQQGKTQEAIGNYNAKVDQNNAIAARQQAEFDAQRIRDRNVRLRGAQTAAASKSGLSISGSVQDVMFDSGTQGELDALTSIYKGSISSNAQVAAARLSTFEGNAAANASYVSAGGTLLGGVANAGQYWMMSKQPGFK